MPRLLSCSLSLLDAPMAMFPKFQSLGSLSQAGSEVCPLHVPNSAKNARLALRVAAIASTDPEPPSPQKIPARRAAPCENWPLAPIQGLPLAAPRTHRSSHRLVSDTPAVRWPRAEAIAVVRAGIINFSPRSRPRRSQDAQLPIQARRPAAAQVPVRARARRAHQACAAASPIE